MKQLNQELKQQIKQTVWEFFAEECEVELSQLHDDTNISDDLDGDSLMFIELIELLKSRYDMNVQLQTIGKYLLKKPADTLGEVMELVYKLYQHGDEIVRLDN